MARTRNFWQHGIQVSIESLKKVPRVDAAVPDNSSSNRNFSNENSSNNEPQVTLETTEINLDSTTD